MRTIMIAAAALTLAGPALAQQNTTQTVQTAPFTAIDASAGTKVIFTPGAQSVTMVGDAEAMERMRVEVRGSTLYVGRKPNIGWGNNSRRWRVEVRVSAPSLTALSVSSGAMVDAKGVSAGPFKLDASSGGAMVVEGRCETLAADVSSGGSLNAGKFACANVRGDASSGGSLNAFATTSKNGNASSGGSVRIAGPGAAGSATKSSGGSVNLNP